MFGLSRLEAMNENYVQSIIVEFTAMHSLWPVHATQICRNGRIGEFLQ